MQEQEKQIKAKNRIKNYLKQIKTYTELCIEEFEDKEPDTYYVDQKLYEISRQTENLKILIREYEDVKEDNLERGILQNE